MSRILLWENKKKDSHLAIRQPKETTPIAF